MTIEQRATFLIVSCLSLSTLFATNHASADELGPNMIWGSMSDPANGGQTTCDYFGSYGYGVCTQGASFTTCYLKTDDPVAQVTAQFQCCDQNYSNCQAWQWTDYGWTPPGAKSPNLFLCAGGSLHFARISCLVAVPNPN